MNKNYWHKQDNDPLFKELLWSKPENKLHAGKLLIIGGNLHSFSSPAQAYQTALNNGIGSCKVLLPASLNKIIGDHLENAEFAPSNKSGSFNSQSLASWLENGAWADGVLLAGDFSNNSETTVVLEKFISKFTGQITISGDALDAFLQNPEKLVKRRSLTLILNFSRLQKLTKALKLSFAFTSNLPIASVVKNLHTLNLTFPLNLILLHENVYFVMSEGQISTTKTTQTNTTNLTEIATKASVWSLQNPAKTFQALTTSVLDV